MRVVSGVERKRGGGRKEKKREKERERERKEWEKVLVEEIQSERKRIGAVERGEFDGCLHVRVSGREVEGERKRTRE